jgi:hypothetical protein
MADQTYTKRERDRERERVDGGGERGEGEMEPPATGTDKTARNITATNTHESAHAHPAGAILGRSGTARMLALIEGGEGPNILNVGVGSSGVFQLPRVRVGVVEDVLAERTSWHVGGQWSGWSGWRFRRQASGWHTSNRTPLVHHLANAGVEVARAAVCVPALALRVCLAPRAAL